MEAVVIGRLPTLNQDKLISTFGNINTQAKKILFIIPCLHTCFTWEPPFIHLDLYESMYNVLHSDHGRTQVCKEQTGDRTRRKNKTHGHILNEN